MGLLANLASHAINSYWPFVVLLVPALLGLRQVYLWHRLRHIPGPPSAAWSVWWQLSGALTGRYHERLRDADNEHGPLVRIGPNQLLSSDPDVLQRISGARSTYTKGPFYRSGRVLPGVDNVVSITDEVKHKAMRAKMAPGYFGRDNIDSFAFEAAIDRQVLKFISLLERKYLSSDRETKPVDFAEKSQFFALDAIGDVSLGEPFGYLTRDDDLYDYNKINTATMPVMNIVSVLPWLTDLPHRWPLTIVLPKESDNYGFGRLMGVARMHVEKRLAPDAKPVQDMLQSHIAGGMTAEELMQQVLVAIIAGSNSTAHAIRMTLLSLSTSPTAYIAILAEIRNATKTVSRPISWSQTQQLPYLQAVVREGLRMWPPIGALVFKVVPPGGEVINGLFVPGGTEVGQNFFGVGRSKRVWGQDANVFRPERWLNARGEELQNMVAAVDTNFGHGKYSCLGKHVALMEIHKCIFELLRNFDVAVIDPETPIKTRASIFFMASDFWVKLTKREQ